MVVLVVPIPIPVAESLVTRIVVVVLRGRPVPTSGIGAGNASMANS